MSYVTESSKVASVHLRVTCAAVHTRLVNGLRALERPAVTLEPFPCRAGGQPAAVTTPLIFPSESVPCAHQGAHAGDTNMGTQACVDTRTCRHAGGSTQPGARKQGRGPWGPASAPSTLGLPCPERPRPRCPWTGPGRRGHRGRGDVGQRVHSLSLPLCLDPEPGGPWGLTPTPSHTSCTSLTQRLARGLHVLVQRAFGTGKLGGHVISGKSLDYWDPQSPPWQNGRDHRPET